MSPIPIALQAMVTGLAAVEEVEGIAVVIVEVTVVVEVGVPRIGKLDIGIF